MTIISDRIKQARMQSLLCNYVVPVIDSDLACFDGIVMPHCDLCLFLIWGITNQKSKCQLWWTRDRWQHIQSLNSHLVFPQESIANMKAWITVIHTVIRDKLQCMTDEEILKLVNVFWPDEMSEDLADEPS